MDLKPRPQDLEAVDAAKKAAAAEKGAETKDPTFVDQALEIERLILDPLHAGLNA